MIYVSKIKTPLGRFSYNSTRYMGSVKHTKPQASFEVCGFMCSLSIFLLNLVREIYPYGDSVFSRR